MKHITTGLTTLIMFLFTTPALAVKVYECVDEGGNSTYQDRCPPGTTPANEKKFYTGAQKTDADAPNVAIALYTVPTCDACDVIRNVLDKYGAGYTEKNVEKNVTLQTELQEKTGGGATLSVPTVIVGEKVIVGYNKQQLVAALEEAGFKVAGAEETEAKSEKSETEESESVADTGEAGAGEQATAETATE